MQTEVPSARVLSPREWPHNTKDVMAGDVLEREIHVAGARIDGDRVRVRSQKTLSELLEVASLLGEDGDHAAFCRDVEQVAARIEIEHIWRLADVLGLNDFHRPQVEHEQLVVGVAGDEGEPPRRVEMPA